VAENEPINTVVGTLSTTDPDTGDTFTYTLVAGAGSADNASFNILGNSLRTSAVFDYETKNSYSIRVRSTDSGGLFFEQQFTVTVTNVNEPPLINDQSFSVAENSPNGTVVGTVLASDPDAGDSLSFAITAGNTGSTFAINPATGQITVNDNSLLNFETNPSFSLTVQVTDTGLLSSSATVTINLTNVIESDLGIIKTANPDPDVGVNQTLTYTLQVENLGPDIAQNINAVDDIPSGMNGVTFVSASGTGWTCDQTPPNSVTCTRATLNVGLAPDITIVVIAPSTPTALSNAATVSLPFEDPDFSNNNDSLITNVI
jgi:uncharacterized repeat protein (TIGR01451 family)